MFRARPPDRVLQLLESFDDIFSEDETAGKSAGVTEPERHTSVIERKEFMSVRSQMRRGSSDAENPLFGLESRPASGPKRGSRRVEFGSSGSTASVSSSTMVCVPEDSAICDFEIPPVQRRVVSESSLWSTEGAPQEQQFRSYTDQAVQNQGYFSQPQQQRQTNHVYAVQQQIRDSSQQLQHQAGMDRLVFKDHAINDSSRQHTSQAIADHSTQLSGTHLRLQQQIHASRGLEQQQMQHLATRSERLPIQGRAGTDPCASSSPHPSFLSSDLHQNVQQQHRDQISSLQDDYCQTSTQVVEKPQHPEHFQNIQQREQLQQLHYILKRQQLERLRQSQAISSQPRARTAPAPVYPKQPPEAPLEHPRRSTFPAPMTVGAVEGISFPEHADSMLEPMQSMPPPLMTPSTARPNKLPQQASRQNVGVRPGQQERSITDLSSDKRHCKKVLEQEGVQPKDMPRYNTMPTTPDKAERSDTQTSAVPVLKKTMQYIAASVETPPSSDDEIDSQLALPPDDGLDIIVGPTKFSVLTKSFEDVWIDGKNNSKESIRSRAASLSVQDVLRLSEARCEHPPLSFGSLLHACGFEKCRPCMFERTAGRCKKVWLCDFCHLHSGRKGKAGHSSG